MKTYSYEDIANWFLSKDSMSPKKLQKLTYYTEAWANALYDQSIINDTEFEAWVHGPVSPELYRKYKSYGWNKIEKICLDLKFFDQETLELLESVWITYGDKSANELEVLTHSEDPWKKARLGYSKLENSCTKIDSNDMKEYYKSIYIGG